MVLLGPNSDGKTSVLDAEELITRAEIRRAHPADPVEVHAEGSAFFDPSGADVPASGDAQTYRWLLCGEHSVERAWDLPGDGPASASGRLAWAKRATSSLIASPGAERPGR